MSQYEKRELIKALSLLADSKLDPEAFHDGRDALIFGAFLQMITRRDNPLSHKDIIAIAKKIQKINSEGPEELWYA